MTTSSAIPAGILENRFRPSRLRTLSPDILDYALFLPGIWLPCALGMSLRLIGPLFLVIPVGLCLLYAVLRRVVPPRLLTAYFAFCVFAGVLSKYRLFPDSWQVLYLEEAIVRQLIPVLGFFAVSWASKAYFRRRLMSGDVFRGGPLILTLSFVVASAVMFQQGLGYEGDHSAFAVLAMLGAFTNNIVIGLFFVLGGIFLTNDWRRRAGLILILGITVTTHFAQIRILTAVILAILYGARSRRLLMGVVVALPATYAVMINFIPQMMVMDPNDGLRLAMVSDAISSAIDTHGIGIGYGKESVRTVYRFPNVPAFHFLPNPRSMTRARMLEALSNGVENSFIQALLRTGVPGFVLFLAAFFAAFPPANLPRNVRNHAVSVFTMIFVGLFVNSALESPLSSVGCAFVYGYLIALRASARVRAPRTDSFGRSGSPGGAFSG